MYETWFCDECDNDTVEHIQTFFTNDGEMTPYYIYECMECHNLTVERGEQI